ncbi:hypothetical protein Rxycam_01862 [Rubrobacter xylanophilus DSM 9941]|nr:hypothetical protein Rxycam_01862 [Rubrobacter xylanophilus DSM 9941]
MLKRLWLRILVALFIWAVLVTAYLFMRVTGLIS